MSDNKLEVTLDPQFSVFKLVDRVRHQSTLLNHRRTMSAISYEIENATLVDSAQTRVFAGFQRFSRFLPQLNRYHRLARKAESVYVFGVPDVTLPPIPGIHYVPIAETDQLSKEWFLVSYGRPYFSALVTEEQSRITDPDEKRLFKGLWTFDPTMVTILYEWLSRVVNAPLHSIDINNHDYRGHAAVLNNTLTRLTARVTRKPRHEFVQSELKTIIRECVQPSIVRLGSLA